MQLQAAQPTPAPAPAAVAPPSEELVQQFEQNQQEVVEDGDTTTQETETEVEELVPATR